jgi:hypothetical protein
LPAKAPDYAASLTTDPALLRSGEAGLGIIRDSA